MIGQTPKIHFRRRIHEIEKYLKETGYEDIPWVAIDDKTELFPLDAPLIITHGYGMTPENAGELRVAVDEMIRSQSNKNVNECIRKLYDHHGPELTLEALFNLDKN